MNNTLWLIENMLKHLHDVPENSLVEVWDEYGKVFICNSNGKKFCISIYDDIILYIPSDDIHSKIVVNIKSFKQLQGLLGKLC